MDARDLIVEDVRSWREELTREVENMNWEEILQYLHRTSDETKSKSGLTLTSMSASEAGGARRRSVSNPSR